MSNSESPHCPNCKTTLLAQLIPLPDGHYQLKVEGQVDPLSRLHQMLYCYLRWVAEGKRPYVHASGEQKAQCYYDPYHDSISYNLETDEYDFHIQVYDSPEGDTWWNGSFTLWGGCVIKDVKDKGTKDF